MKRKVNEEDYTLGFCMCLIELCQDFIFRKLDTDILLDFAEDSGLTRKDLNKAIDQYPDYVLGDKTTQLLNDIKNKLEEL